jgi:selenocysteine lyase/cysteine desulfurase
MSSRRAFIQAVASAAAAGPLLGRLHEIEEAFASSIDELRKTVLEPAALRQRYLLADDVVYLNHASIGTVPRAVHEARVRLQAECESNPWLYIFGGGWEAAREVVREEAARFVGCTASDLAITHNTTEGFNVLARGLPLGPGDEVLFPSINHDGASICWRHSAEERGFAVRRFPFPITETAGLTARDVVAIYADQIRPETRVLVFPHIDNIVGLRHPLRALASMAHDRGVEFVFVDGAQSVGMIPVNLAASGVDAYAASPHKWVQAPKGLGLFFVNEAVRRVLRPMWVTWGQNRWAGTVRVFEDYGTRDMPDVLALGDALRFQESLGATAKTQAYERMYRRLFDAVDSAGSLRWHSPGTWDMGASLVAVETMGRASDDVRRRIQDVHGIVVRAFGVPELNALRVSPNVATTDEELDLFISAASS